MWAPQSLHCRPQMPRGARERGMGEVLALDPWGRAAFPQLPFHLTLSCVRLNVPGVGIHQQRTGRWGGGGLIHTGAEREAGRQEGSA